MLLRRLAVFAGGFDLEAAEAACADHILSAADVLDLLTRLVDRSLVLFEEQDAGGRYRLLETVRQYALDRLLEAGEHDTWRSRHQNYYEAWSEALRQTVEEAEGSGTEIHLAAFALEHDNLRAALQWSWTSHQPTVTLRLAAATSAFWDRTDYISEGRRWLEAGITGAGESAPADLRARAYYFAGALAWHQGEYGQARAYLERSLSLSRTLDAHDWVSLALSFLGAIAYRQGEYARAAALLDESQTLSRQTGRRSHLAFSLYLRSVVARLQGDYARAEALGTEALSMSRAINHGRRQRTALDNLGLIARNRGDLERAEAYCAEALAVARRQPDRFGISASLNSLALIACDRGDWKHARDQVDEGLAIAREMENRAAEARALNILGRIELHEEHEDRALALHRDALTIFRELGEPLGIAQSLERLGVVAGARREYESATQLFAAAARLRERMGSSMPPVDRAEYEEMLGTIRVALEENRFHAIWDESAAAPDQVVATALAAPTPSPGS